VHVVPNLGRKDRAADMPPHDRAVGGLGIHRGSSSIGLAGKDADIVILAECGIAVHGAIETRQSESQGEKPNLKVERQMDHSNPVAREARRSNLAKRKS
jgi:hypothetical protein